MLEAIDIVGTTYLPPSSRHFELNIGTGAPVFVPSRLGVAVDYRDLAANEKIDSVAPDLYQAGELSWIEPDAATLSPWGSVVDIALEDTAQQRLYFIGVIIGLLAAVVPLSVSSARRRVARMGSRAECP